MTWTLRFYDSVGVEIGWVQTDPWQYKITHPGDMSEIDDLLYQSKSPAVMSTGETVVDTEDDPWVSEEYTFPGTWDPLDHIKYIRDNLNHEKIDSRELNDE